MHSLGVRRSHAELGTRFSGLVGCSNEVYDRRYCPTLCHIVLFHRLSYVTHARLACSLPYTLAICLTRKYLSALFSVSIPLYKIGH